MLPTQEVTHTNEDGVAPGPLTGGGTIPDGTYRLITRQYYGTALNHTYEKDRFEVSGSGTVFENVYEWSNVPETRLTYDAVVASPSITLTRTCPSAQAAIVETYDVDAGADPIEVTFRYQASANLVTFATYVKED